MPVYTPNFASNFGDEATRHVFLRHTGPTDSLGYRIAMAKVGNVHVISAVFEGVARPAWYPSGTPNAGTGSAASASNTTYWTYSNDAAYHQWTVSVEGAGCDRLIVHYVGVSGGTELGVYRNYGTAGQELLGTVNTNHGGTSYRISTTVALSSPLAQGDTVRFRRLVGGSGTARFAGFVAYKSAVVAGSADPFVLPAETQIDATGSSVEFACNIAQPADATKWVGGADHQTAPTYHSEVNPVETWTRNGNPWTPATGWQSGVFTLHRTTDVQDGGDGSTILGSFAYTYSFGANSYGVSHSFVPVMTLKTGSIYAAMIETTQCKAAVYNTGRMVDLQVTDEGEVHLPVGERQISPILAMLPTPGGAVWRIAVSDLSHALQTVFVWRRASTRKAYWRLAVPASTDQAWGATWVATFDSFAITPDLPVIGDVRVDVSYGHGLYVGQCAVPAPDRVSLDVPVDDTAGTAILTQADVEAAMQAMSPAGRGARTIMVTVLDAADEWPLAGARVRLSLGGQSWVAVADADGQAVLHVDDGAYAVVITRSDYTFDGATLIVDGDEWITYYMDAKPVPTAPDVTHSSCYLYTFNGAGQPKAGVMIEFKIDGTDGAAAASYPRSIFGVVSNDSGLVSCDLPRGFRFRARRIGVNTQGPWVPFVVSDGPSTAIPEVLGQATDTPD